ncbi:MAG: hypothetical protein U0Q18_22770 [Bryobacteraceae bacterium]
MGQDSIDRAKQAISDESPADHVWRHTLSRIPTVFGRLVYLASLRNPNSDSYEHHGLTQMFGSEHSEEILRESHGRVFHDWLCLSLEQQSADVHEYLAELQGNPANILKTWQQLRPYRNLVPKSARDVERDLYLSDLETLLEVMRAGLGAASSDPEASRFR